MNNNIKKIVLPSAVFIFIVLTFCCVFISACAEEEKVKEYSLNYLVSAGGVIAGECEQRVISGNAGSLVKAIPENGFVFDKWSDGNTNPKRTDTITDCDLTFVACFVREYWNITYTVNDFVACSNISEPESFTVEYNGMAGICVYPAPGYVFEKWSDGVTTAARFDGRENAGKVLVAEFKKDFGRLPVISIDTSGAAINDKENYVSCSVTLENAGEYDFEELTAGVRLRGNSTMGLPKKPYRIKFDSKQSMFGLQKNKSWVLLAMYLDYSYIKDYTAFACARSLDTDVFVPNAKHIELYLNGIYQGLYLLTDQVDEKTGRTDVEDEDFFASGSPDTTPPFLVELDEYSDQEGKENEVWFKIENPDGTHQLFNVKYPEFDDGYDYTIEQFNMIKDYITTVNNICWDKETTRETFEQYVDISTFIDYYLVQEFMENGEINWKSIYMSKTTDGKLKMGPIWDFDWSCGGPVLVSENFMGQSHSKQWLSSYNWFMHMLEKDWFQSEVVSRWEEILPVLLNTIENIKNYKNVIAEVAEKDMIIWHSDATAAFLGFSDYFDHVMDSLTYRSETINTLLGIS